MMTRAAVPMREALAASRVLNKYSQAVGIALALASSAFASKGLDT